MRDRDILARLDITRDQLPAAPATRPPARITRERLGPPDSVPCCVCGQMAIATRRMEELPGGPYWLDTCRTHLLIASGRSMDQ